MKCLFSYLLSSSPIAVHSLAVTRGAVAIQEHLSEGQYGVLWKQFIKHQLAISESPAHWPTATQVSPDTGLGDGLGEGDGEGDGDGIGDGTGDGAGEGGGIVMGGKVGKTMGLPPMEISAQALNVSCGPHPTAPVPSEQTPQLLPVKCLR